MNRMLLILLLVAPSFALAETVGEIRLNANLAANHFLSPKPELAEIMLARLGTDEYNNDTFGLGVEYQLSESLYVSAGFFENSFFQDSKYVSIGSQLLESEYVTFGAEIGIADGYENYTDHMRTGIDDDKVFIGGVFVSAGTENNAIKLTSTVSFVGLQYQYTFDRPEYTKSRTRKEEHVEAHRSVKLHIEYASDYAVDCAQGLGQNFEEVKHTPQFAKDLANCLNLN